MGIKISRPTGGTVLKRQEVITVNMDVVTIVDQDPGDTVYQLNEEQVHPTGNEISTKNYHSIGPLPKKVKVRKGKNNHSIGPLPKMAKVRKESDVMWITSDIWIHTKECIGSGTFGSVFRGDLNGYPCAVKIFYPLGDQGQTTSAQTFQTEFEHLESFKHPNIVQHLATRTHAGHQILALELMDCNLTQFLSPLSVESLALETQKSLCHNIASALAYIHSRQIIHSDLCSNNILLDCKRATPVAKICDFGMFNNKSTSIPILALKQSEYLPPEATQFEWIEYDYSFDIFSAGVIMIQIVRRLPTVQCRNRDEEFSKIESSSPLKFLIKQCLHESKDHRPSAVDLESQIVIL